MNNVLLRLFCNKTLTYLEYMGLYIMSPTNKRKLPDTDHQILIYVIGKQIKKKRRTESSLCDMYLQLHIFFSLKLWLQPTNILRIHCRDSSSNSIAFNFVRRKWWFTLSNALENVEYQPLSVQRVQNGEVEWLLTNPSCSIT